MPQAFTPFKHRSFAVYWTGAFVSNVGTWMETVALGYYVTNRTGKGLWAAIIASAAFIPIGLFGPVGGALADRLNRRKILIYGNVVEAALAALLTVLFATDNLPPWAAAVIVFGSGCASALAFPAFSALVPDLVPKEELVKAISLNSAQWNLGRVVGPAFAGIVIYALGSAWAFGINAVSFLAVIVALTMIAVPDRAKTVKVAVWRSIQQGVKFTRTEPGLRAMSTMMFFATIFAAPFIALLPAMAKKVFHGGSGTVSWLVTAQGCGAVIAALNMGRLSERFGSRKLMNWSLWSLPVATILYAVAPNLPLSVMSLVLLGGCYLASLNCYSTIAQTRAPAQFRGRVLAVNTFILGAFYPLSSLIQGRLSDTIGLRKATAIYGVGLAIVLLSFRVFAPHFTAPIDVPVDATSIELANAFQA